MQYILFQNSQTSCVRYILRDNIISPRDDHVYTYTWVQPSTGSGANQFLVAVLGK